MTTSRILARSARVAAMLAAATVLLTAADGASAKNGGGSAGSKHSESHEDNGKVSAEKRKDQGREYASKTRDNRHKPAPAPGTGGTNNIHPIVNPQPVAQPVAPSPSKVVAGITNGVLSGHLESGPEGLTAVVRSPGTITISNGTNTLTFPGNSVTLTGAAVTTCAGCVMVKNERQGPITVVADPKKGYYPNGDPSRGVFGTNLDYPGSQPANPTAPKPVSVTVTGGSDGVLGTIGDSILDAGKAIGRGAVDIISIGSPTPGSPAAGTPPPKTSTTTQY